MRKEQSSDYSTYSTHTALNPPQQKVNPEPTHNGSGTYPAKPAIFNKPKQTQTPKSRLSSGITIGWIRLSSTLPQHTPSFRGTPAQFSRCPIWKYT